MSSGKNGLIVSRPIIVVNIADNGSVEVGIYGPEGVEVPPEFLAKQVGRVVCAIAEVNNLEVNKVLQAVTIAANFLEGEQHIDTTEEVRWTDEDDKEKGD